MASSFPGSLDTFTNPTSADALDSVSVPHATQHSDLNDAVEALEAKVGADGSAVTSSHDYKIAQLPAGVLAYAEDDTDTTINTSGSDIVNVAVTLATTRTLKITFCVGNLSTPSTNLSANHMVRDAAAGTGNILAEASLNIGTGSGYVAVIPSVQVVFVDDYAAGTHNFYAHCVASTGTYIVNGTTGRRKHFIIVEDLGAA